MAKKAVDLRETFGELLDAFREIESMLEAWAACGPEGMSPDERRRKRAAERVFDAAQRAWLAMPKGGDHADAN